jgi:hypothetical protein
MCVLHCAVQLRFSTCRTCPTAQETIQEVLSTAEHQHKQML